MFQLRTWALLASVLTLPCPVSGDRIPGGDHRVAVDVRSIGCVEDPQTLCLGDGRFRVSSEWQTSDAQVSGGEAARLEDETGSFRSPQARDHIVVRVLDACDLNHRFWVLAGGSGGANATIRVTDTLTRTTKVYSGLLAGSDYRSMADTETFTACDSSRTVGESQSADASLISREALEEIVRTFDASAREFLATGDATVLSRRRATLHPRNPSTCNYSLTPATQQIPSTAASGTVSVTAESGCSWTATSASSWLTFTAGRGNGSGSAAFSATANTGSSSRTATVTIGGKTASVTQLGPCTFTVSPTSKDFPSAGGSDSVSVTTRSDCAWTASVSTTATWITITAGTTGMGNGAVSYSVAANSSTSSRSGSMTIGGRTVTIRQSADISSCTYTAEYSSRTVSWCGGERTVRLTTQGDCPWTASSNVPWITIPLSDRTGTRDLAYVITQNTTGSARQALLTVAGKQVTINQTARSSGGTYDGNWTGTTNGNRSVTMCVAENAIQSVEISVRLVFPTFACTTPLIRQDSLAITGNSFNGTFTTYPEVSNIFTTARGTFTSSTAMNGSWDPYSGSYVIFCGSTIGFGTAGTILSSGTFTATKQP